MVESAAPPGTLPVAGGRRVLAVLCATEITSWGILHYAFPVLSVSISHGTGWSLPVITAAFSLGQLASALTGIPVGRILDAVGPRTVMTAGSLLGVAALAVVALARHPVVFYAGWVAAGVGMGAVLYPPAFAALTRWWRSARYGAAGADPGGWAGEHRIRAGDRRAGWADRLAGNVSGARGGAGGGDGARALVRVTGPLAPSARPAP